MEPGADGAGSERRCRRTQLVRGEDPAVHDRHPLAPKCVSRQGDGWRHRGHPVQPVEDDEREQPKPARGVGEGQEKQREPAKPVVHEEQAPAVITVGQPARRHRPGDVEDADHREQARGPDLWDTAVDRRWDQVGADQAIRRESADEEAGRQQPELAAAYAQGQPAKGVRNRTAPRAAARLGVRRSERSQSDVGRPAAHEEGDDRENQKSGPGHGQRRPSPAGGHRQPGEGGQEDELTGSARRGQDADHEAAAGNEPAVGHHRAEHGRH